MTRQRRRVGGRRRSCMGESMALMLYSLCDYARDTSSVSDMHRLDRRN